MRRGVVERYGFRRGGGAQQRCVLRKVLAIIWLLRTRHEVIGGGCSLRMEGKCGYRKGCDDGVDY